VIAELEEDMQQAANRLEFERAALLRDQIRTLREGGGRSNKASSYRQKPAPRKSRR